MQKWMNVFRVTILLAFFVSTLFLVIGVPDTFNSPDESANAFFARQFAETGTLKAVEERNEQLYGILHPRSISAMGASLVPVSFHGLQVTAGTVAFLFGKNAIFIVTPLLAVFAVIAWWMIVKCVTKDNWFADIAALFFLLHPAFWYYTGRVMMHNVGFVALVLIGCCLAFVRPISQKYAWAKIPELFFGGGLVVLAIAFRFIEIVWVLPLILGLLVLTKKIWTKKDLLSFAFGALAVGMLFFFVNAATYDAWFLTGYQIESSASLEAFSEQEIEQQEVTEESGSRISILPFGFAPRAMLIHMGQYIVALYPWMFIPAFIGFLLALKKKREKHWKAFHVAAIAISAWLVIMYGSWVFNDNPDPRVYSLGNSYVRYWIPIFLFSSVYAAYAMQELAKRLPKRWRTGVVTLVVLACALLSGREILYGTDGFVHTRGALFKSELKQEKIIELTEDDAVIIVDRSDKFVFPHRAVVVPLRSDVTYAAMPHIAEVAPLYYFGITLPQKDIDYLNEVKLLETNMMIRHIETVRDESLYKIEKR